MLKRGESRIKLNWPVRLLISVLAPLLLLAACRGPAATPTPIPALTPAPTPTPVVTPATSATPSATPTPTAASSDGSPDLTVTDVSFTPASVEVGESFSVTFMVRNQGRASSGPFSVRISLATTPRGTDFPMGDFVPGGAGFETQGMPAGSGRKTTIDIPIFSSIPPGSYWVTVFADSFEAVAESDESNNMASSDPNRITVNPSTSTLSPTADSRALTSISLEEALASGKPTLADFGYRVCEACKAMAVIWQELAVEYKGKLNVVIVDVYEQKELTRQYRIMAIPTQIVFDSTGKEITRHMGFWPKEEILALLKKMGIE